MDGREILLNRLFEAGDFQALQDKLAAALEIAIITVDFDGNPVSKHSGCSVFCKRIRNHPEYGEYCKVCDARGGLEANRQKRPFIYICHMGLADFAIPISVNGSYIGSVMAGQIKISESGLLERVTDRKNEHSLDESLLSDCKSRPEMSYDRVKALSEMLYSLYNYVSLEAAKKISDIPVLRIRDVEKAPSVILPAMEYIMENYTKSIRQGTLSDMCGICPSYFSKLFKKIYGDGPVVYINKLRIEKAKELLAKTKKSVSDIAYETGFDDCGYFIKTFKKITDTTPGSYREHFSFPLV